MTGFKYFNNQPIRTVADVSALALDIHERGVNKTLQLHADDFGSVLSDARNLPHPKHDEFLRHPSDDPFYIDGLVVEISDEVEKGKYVLVNS